MGKRIVVIIFGILCVALLMEACKKETVVSQVSNNQNNDAGDVLDLPSQPFNYSNIDFPNYIDSVFKYSDDWNNEPSTNPITDHGATLGRVLFYDTKLSTNDQVSCASCHDINHGFSDPNKQSKGVNGLTGRNSMSIVNLRFWAPKGMFWDMRAKDLEEQVLMPITNHLEMGNSDLASVLVRISKQSYYRQLFKNAFGSEVISSERVAFALSQFIRSIVSFQSKFDVGQTSNFSNFTNQEKNGMNIFVNQCSECHGGIPFGGGTKIETRFISMLNVSFNYKGQFIYGKGGKTNNGLDLVYKDKGMGETDPSMDGIFKTPMLRNIELTAPYMHDGRFSTLEEVIEFYSSNVKEHPNKGVQIPPGGFNFSTQEKQDLLAFLKTLTDQILSKSAKYNNPFKK
ncbi:MAG TPA: cytochrome c peroxidase [Bacteroidia bacterium]